ncbi:MAG: type II secretion system F family protein [Planctomycetota bacterium]
MQSTRQEKETSFHPLWRDRLLGGHQNQLAAFLSECAAMLRAGLPLAQAIELAASPLPKRPLATWAYESAERVRNGAAFSEEIEAAPGLFPPPLAELVRAGEASGRMEPILDRASEQLLSAARRRRTLLTKLAYPALLVHVAILATNTFQIRDGLTSMFAAMALDLLVLYAVIGLAVFAWRRIRDSRHRTWIDERLPFWSTLRASRCQGDFLEALGALYGAGVGMRTAWDRAARTVPEGDIRRGLDLGAQALDRGGDVTEAFATSGWPTSITAQVRTGEISGRLEESLLQLCTQQQASTELLADRLASVSQKAIYTLVVLYVVYSILSFYFAYFGALFAL